MVRNKIEKVACSVNSPNMTDSIRLPDNSSIFTAEAKAIDTLSLYQIRDQHEILVHHLFKFSFCIKIP